MLPAHSGSGVAPAPQVKGAAQQLKAAAATAEELLSDAWQASGGVMPLT